MQATLVRAAAAFTADAAEADLTTHASAILKALEEYSRRTERICRRQSTEYQHMVQMLADTLGEITSTSQENLQQLREIENQIAWAAQIDDVRMLKARLSDCLKQIREEAARHHLSDEGTIEKLGVQCEVPSQTSSQLVRRLQSMRPLAYWGEVRRRGHREGM